MDLACPACGSSLPGTLSGGVTVIECSACARRVLFDEDGVGFTLPLAADDPPPTLGGEATVDRLSETLSCSDARAGAATEPREFAAGQRFGDYDILTEIARGGMGVVFKARQVKLNRVVALKMILGGQLAREDQVARFYAEAQAAAHLDHPGIVPVYEVGELHGQHFFSMGFVDGVSLSDRLAAGPLPPREAADLIHKTARAVAYAHAQGVIHRDLKPSNVLIDAAGQPRVTDFGLAKNVTSGAEADSGLTLAGTVIGTPSYMPPEQAAGRTGEVGALADVYALGATLYCLLVGRPPFQAASVTETLRQVSEQEPVSPRRLNPAVDRDLETICLKCLEKEAGRRYGSAAGLADDVQCYLAHRPIVARPISSPARLARWCRRNPRVAALAAAFLFVLAGGAAVSTYFAIEATNNAAYFRKEKERADDEAKKATANAEFFRLEKVRADGETQKAVTALARETEALQKQAAALEETEASIYKYVQTIHNDKLLRDARFKPLINELLAEAAAHYERYIERHKDDRDVPSRAKLAAAFFEVAVINTFQGTTDAAFAAYAQLLPIQEQLVRDNPGVAQYEADLARSQHNRGNLLHMTGKSPAALVAYQQALGVRERLARDNPTLDEYQNDLFATLNNIGNLHYQSSRPAEALKAFEQAIAVQEKLAAAHADVLEYHVKLSAGYMNVGSVYYSTNRPNEALVSFQKAQAIQERLCKENPTNTEAHSRLAGVHQNLGNLYAAMEKPSEALAAYQKALYIREQVAQANPTVDQYQSDVASSLHAVGLEHKLAGRPAESKLCYEKVLAISERLVRDNPSIADYQVNLAGTYVDLAALKAAADPQAALADIDKAKAMLEAVLKINPSDLTARNFLRNAHMGLGDLHDAAGRFAQAAEDWQRAVELSEDSDFATRYSNLRELALAQARAGQHQNATKTVERLDRRAKHGDQWRNLAKVLALCSAAAAKDEALAADQRAALADSYAVQAMGFLTRAEEFGIYQDPQRVRELQADPDYNSLRERGDFRELLQRLPGSTLKS